MEVNGCLWWGERPLHKKLPDGPYNHERSVLGRPETSIPKIGGRRRRGASSGTLPSQTPGKKTFTPLGVAYQVRCNLLASGCEGSGGEYEKKREGVS